MHSVVKKNHTKPILSEVESQAVFMALEILWTDSNQQPIIYY